MTYPIIAATSGVTLITGGDQCRHSTARRPFSILGVDLSRCSAGDQRRRISSHRWRISAGVGS